VALYASLRSELGLFLGHLYQPLHEDLDVFLKAGVLFQMTWKVGPGTPICGHGSTRSPRWN
jgi:hypothetical protein